ncbi:alpha/beta fold hydrolase [Agromyces sp. MMS24-JH15]|uniref:alpha/beta fold hydrolase n=1 Tax=Agromyces sp. MMS24-JH15 TaxID=3243765 RepID=UPI00374A82CB
MDVILIPGFWLDASSWDDVTPLLVEAGHRVHPVTLPGLESPDADRAGITLADWVAAVADRVDALDGPIALVGHSGGGAVAHGVADARPDRIERVVYVDAGPQADGVPINDELPVLGDEVPLPDWSVFLDEDLVDLDDDLRAAFRARAIPIPKAAATEGLRLHDERRYGVPITVICCEFPSAVLVEAVGAGLPWVSELAGVEQVSYIDLPTGHWPQFTKPVQLGQAIVSALEPPIA